MRLLVDENIPLARHAFSGFGTVATVPGSGFTPEAVGAADVLLVRSVTAVTERVVAGTPVRFVGTATIGTDHLDLPALAARGIEVASAPGSNAASVVEWAVAALVAVAARRGVPLAGRTAGVVGVGNVGRRLVPRLEALGVRVLACDPPRAAAEGPAGFVPLSDVLAAADIVTLHTPLVRSGPHATHPLLGAPELAQLRPGAWLVNACRGPVVDNAALLAALARGAVGAALLDVFDPEPVPDAALLAAADLVTPHVAGYSYDGKLNGARMLYDALVRWTGTDPAFDWEAAYALAPEDARAVDVGGGSVLGADPSTLHPAALHPAVRALYDIEADDARFRQTLALPDAPSRARAFADLRKHYPRRRAWEHYRSALPPALAAVLLPG